MTRRRVQAASHRSGRRIPFTARARREAAAIGRFALFLMFALWVCLPLWFTVMSAFSHPVEMIARPPHWIPEAPTMDNFVGVLTRVTDRGYTGETGALLVGAMVASAGIGISVAGLNVLIAGLTAYGYSRFRFRGHRVGYVFLLMSRIVPAIALVTPFFVAFRLAGLIDTPVALVITYLLLTLPLSIWLLRSYFDALSPEVEEAATVDGAGHLLVLWLIVAPLARPGLIATGLLVFLVSWDEFFYANVLTNQMTVPPLLASYSGLEYFSWNTLAAAIVLSLIPPIAIVAGAQRYIVSGLSHGSAK